MLRIKKKKAKCKKIKIPAKRFHLCMRKKAMFKALKMLNLYCKRRLREEPNFKYWLVIGNVPLKLEKEYRAKLLRKGR